MTEIFPQSSHGLRIKICGITSASDAREAIACGADALGFNFYRGSKRYIDIAAEADWLSRVSAEVVRVALLVNPTWEEAVRLAQTSFIDVLQLHGDEPPEFCAALAEQGIPFIKALAVESEESLVAAERFSTRTVLLDSRSEGFGGSGKTFEWSLAARFVAGTSFDVFIAGGLTPSNVAEAVGTVRPFGVDVTTGVESAPRQKSAAKMRAFIDAARAARA